MFWEASPGIVYNSSSVIINNYLNILQGHDVNILEDMLSHAWRPPILWVEWFIIYTMISNNRIEGWGLAEVKNRII